MSAEKLLEGLEGLDASSFSSEAERMRARDRLYNALRRVQSPWDIVWEHNWVNGATNASIRALIQADVFPKIAEAPQTSEDLAKLTGGEAIVFRMSPRHAARMWPTGTDGQL